MNPFIVFRRHIKIWEDSSIQEKSSVSDPVTHVEDNAMFILPPSHDFALCSVLETKAHCEESWDNKFGGDFKGHWG